MEIRKIALVAFLAAAWAGAATAQPTGLAGTIQVRLRAVTVAPDASATITVNGAAIGGSTKVTDSVVPEFDISYFVTDNFSVELIAAVTRHTVSNSIAGRVASVSLLPPTLTAQYHFDPRGPIRPYVGAGINYTTFYDASSALTPIKFSDNFGWVLQAGVDVPVREGYFLNFDVKKLFLNTSINAAGGTVRAKASLDPWLVGMGVGVRF
jgi:outer membrane protein